mmetsp:Transcript_35937/g.55211  ORF Transcript_35937/g.55211 Transcript_35937/m.55211 type:complete len:170 (-) Transcript_35937:58-567(-)
MSGYDIREIRAIENKKDSYDAEDHIYRANKHIFDQYGRDPYSYQIEDLWTGNRYWERNEGSFSHGYPTTAYFQLALIYGCGLYTAQKQGIVKRGVFFQRYWRHHYFDWTLFLKRSFKIGVVGGMVAGTYLFGDPELAWKRLISKFNMYIGTWAKEKQDSESCYAVKFNN